jgi:hypothetical protein
MSRKVKDSIANTMHAQAREYMPNIGRFALGFAYFQHLESIKNFGWFNFLARDVWDFADHDLSAIKEGGA